jgi:DNA-binding NtrC family response regulator
VLSPEAVVALQAYPWPGNIRELESTVSRAALSAPGHVIRDSDIEFLHANMSAAVNANPHLPTMREVEKTHVARVLEAAQWNKKEAARILDVSRGTLYRKIVEYGLAPEVPLSRSRTPR